MEYNKIIAVTGLPGLYELVSSKNDGAIVRSLDDKTSKFVSSRIHSFSHLESIEIYTVRDNVNLVDILLAMQNSKTALPDTKDNAAVRKYFESAYPDLDFDRVYASDMKKMVKWYEVLKSNGVEIKLSEPEPEPEVVAAAPEEEKPAKAAAKAAKPKSAPKEEVKEEAPKKTAKKKEAADTEKEKPAKPATAKPAKAKKEDEKTAAPKKAAPKAASKGAAKKK
jgi:hypothetical protein